MKLKLLWLFILDLKRKKMNWNLKLAKYSKVGFKFFLDPMFPDSELYGLGAPRTQGRTELELHGLSETFQVLSEKKGWYLAKSRLTGDIGNIPSNYFCSGEYILYHLGS